MSVLNNFMLVFEAEGDDVAIKAIDKVDKAGQKLDKTNKGISESTGTAAKRAKSASAEFRQLTRSVAAAIAPAMALGSILNRTINFAAQGEGLLFMAKSANMAADEFQKLAIASQRFGGSREGAAGMMAGLASQIQALRLGQSAPLQDAAMFYGLNLQGQNGGLATGNELLRNIAATMERLDSAAQLDLGHRIGLDEATIRILQQGVAAFDAELERAQKRSIFKPEDLKRAQELQMSVRDLQLSMQGLWAEIARWLLPAVQSLTEFATQAVDYFTEHSAAVKAVLVSIAVVMGAIAAASLAAFAPWAGAAATIGAVGAAIAIVYDDFVTFCEGGESYFSVFWEPLVEFGKFWQDLPTWIREAASALSEFWNPLKLITNSINFLKKSKLFPIGGNTPFFNSGATSLQLADLNPLASMQPGSISYMYNNPVSRMIQNSFMLTVNGVKDPVQGGVDLLNGARGFDELGTGQEG